MAISRGRGQTTASYQDCALTGTLPHGPRDYYDIRYARNTLWVARMRYAMRIRYGPRECDMRIRYGPRVYAMGRANTLWAARMRYAKNATSRANTLCGTRIGYALYNQLQSGLLACARSSARSTVTWVCLMRARIQFAREH